MLSQKFSDIYVSFWNNSQIVWHFCTLIVSISDIFSLNHWIAFDIILYDIIWYQMRNPIWIFSILTFLGHSRIFKIFWHFVDVPYASCWQEREALKLTLLWLFHKFGFLKKQKFEKNSNSFNFLVVWKFWFFSTDWILYFLTAVSNGSRRLTAVRYFIVMKSYLEHLWN